MRNNYECCCQKCGAMYMAYREDSKHCPNHRYLSSPRYFQRLIEDSKKKGVKRTPEQKKQIILEQQRERRRLKRLAEGRIPRAPKPAELRPDKPIGFHPVIAIPTVSRVETVKKEVIRKVMPEATIRLRVNAKTTFMFTTEERKDKFIKKHPELFQ